MVPGVVVARPRWPFDLRMVRSSVLTVRVPVITKSVDAPSKVTLVSAMAMSPFTSRVVPESVVRVPEVKLSEVSDLRN